MARIHARQLERTGLLVRRVLAAVEAVPLLVLGTRIGLEVRVRLADPAVALAVLLTSVAVVFGRHPAGATPAARGLGLGMLRRQARASAVNGGGGARATPAPAVLGAGVRFPEGQAIAALAVEVRVVLAGSAAVLGPELTGPAPEVNRARRLGRDLLGKGVCHTGTDGRDGLYAFGQATPCACGPDHGRFEAFRDASEPGPRALPGAWHAEDADGDLLPVPVRVRA